MTESSLTDAKHRTSITEPITEEEIGELIAEMLAAASRDGAMDRERLRLAAAALSLRSGDVRPAKARDKEGSDRETALYDLAYAHGAEFGMHAAEGPEAEAHVRRVIERRTSSALAVLKRAPPGLPRDSGTSDYLTGWNEAREAAAKFCETHVAYYQGAVPLKLVTSTTGERYGHLFAESIRALEPSTGKELGKEGSS